MTEEQKKLCKENCCAGRFIYTIGCMTMDGKCNHPNRGKQEIYSYLNGDKNDKRKY